MKNSYQETKSSVSRFQGHTHTVFIERFKDPTNRALSAYGLGGWLCAAGNLFISRGCSTAKLNLAVSKQENVT